MSQPMIEFVHPCHTPLAKKKGDGNPVVMPYAKGAKVPESDIDKEWLAGALTQQFVKRVEAGAAQPTKDEPPKS